MPRTVFYDITATDRTQITGNIASRHDVALVENSLNPDNVDPEAEVISVFISSAVTAEIIDALPRLKLIACRSTGFNNVDLEAAREHGVTVVNVSTYGEHTVAEYTFALLLSLTRRLEEAVGATSSGKLDHQLLRGTDLYGKTLGIVGTGRIGMRTAEIARGFGMELLGYDPYPNKERAAEVGLEHVSLEDLAIRSDVVSLHAPLTDDNHDLIGGDFFNRTKPTAILLNTARGELVETRALIDALETGKLAGAGLDVINNEQLLDVNEELILLRQNLIDPEKLAHSLELSVLKKLPNVILTKHNAFNTIEAVGRINATTLENIENYLKGEPSNVVT